MNKKFTTYNALDFAQDDKFIQWVKKNDPAVAEQWEQWLSEHPEKQAEVEKAKVIVMGIQVEEKEPEVAQINALWDKIDQGISTEQSPVKVRKLRWLPYAAAAAVAALMFFLIYDPGTTVNAPYGELVTYELPDGSQVELNAGSKIWFKADEWSENRSLTLSGEAFFKVEKGSKFTVETKQGRVAVLGTSFNVFARENQLEVDCFTGKVGVSVPKGDSTVLQAGEATKTSANRQLEEKKTIDINKKAGWRKGQLDMVDVPLQRVFDELERQFDIQIKTVVPDETLEQRVNVYFEKTQLDSALTRATWPFSLDFEIEGAVVNISKSE
jgi:ferric-dicitrate binding protein FerR (iron transport regulator)